MTSYMDLDLLDDDNFYEMRQLSARLTCESQLFDFMREATTPDERFLQRAPPGEYSPLPCAVEDSLHFDFPADPFPASSELHQLRGGHEAVASDAVPQIQTSSSSVFQPAVHSAADCNRVDNLGTMPRRRGRKRLPETVCYDAAYSDHISHLAVGELFVLCHTQCLKWSKKKPGLSRNPRSSPQNFFI